MTELEIVARDEKAAVAKAAEKFGVPVEYIEVLEEYEPDELDLKQLAEDEGLEELPSSDQAALFLVSASFQYYVDRAQEWTQGLIEKFAPGSTAEAVRFRHLIVIRINVPESSILIGRKGATLDALQHIVVRAMLAIDENFPDIMLDVDRYREKKLQRLEREAKRAAQRAERTGKRVPLTPMKPAERKFIHNVLKDFEAIKTESRGKDHTRHIVVESTKPAPRGGGRGGGGRGGNKGGGRGGKRGGDQRPSYLQQSDPNDRLISERDRQLLYGKLQVKEEEELERSQAEQQELHDAQLEDHSSLLPEYIPHEDGGEDDDETKLVDEIE